MLGFWFAGIPYIVALWKRQFFKNVGMIRYMITMNLLLFMMLLPVKMILRWTINLKYLVVTPWFNI